MQVDELVKLLNIIKQGGIVSTLIIPIILIIFLFRKFDLIEAFKGLHNLKRKKLEEIICNKNTSINTRELAKQELNALYNYQLTGVFHFSLREPIVRIITQNKLPASYFKPFKAYLDYNSNLIVINEKNYTRKKKLHLFILTIPSIIFCAMINIKIFLSISPTKGILSIYFITLPILAFILITKPPHKKPFNTMKTYVEKYNQSHPSNN
ncbi:hypothetical protein [Hafnia paralvei]|uniref:hypothetical protein n=1 Tax=Hafnia paralvei TaxID=546367 RepID=UPI0024A7ACF4|nr:hypothetical protein [Hafnia paralvei]